MGDEVPISLLKGGSHRGRDLDRQTFVGLDVWIENTQAVKNHVHIPGSTPSTLSISDPVKQIIGRPNTSSGGLLI